MGASIANHEAVGEGAYNPSFESKLDIKEPDAGVISRRVPANAGILRSTSFFVRALNDEQKEINTRENKKAQIDALQAELDSSMLLPNSSKLMPNQGTKLAPLNLNATMQEMQKAEQAENRDPLEVEKDRQRSLLSTLTYEMMNPVCLVAKGKRMRKQARRDEKLIMQQSGMFTPNGAASALNNNPNFHQAIQKIDPMGRHLSDMGIGDVSQSNAFQKDKRASIAVSRQQFATFNKPVIVEDQSE